MISVHNVKKTLVIASRKSDLARLQAYTVGHEIEKKIPQVQIKYHFRESLGDVNLNDPLWKMPEKGVFTEDFYQDLVQHKVDLVVHSWKDLPVEDKEKTLIAGTLEREDLRDVLLFKKKSCGKNNLKIFSSSPRRIYNLESFLSWSLPWKFSSLEFVNVRGNIQTRLRKLLESDQDGLVVAKAALDRLLSAKQEEFQKTKKFISESLKDLYFQVIPLSQNPTAAAQGALAIEVAKDRQDVLEIIQLINHQKTYHNVSFERKELKKYGGGCHQKIGISVIDKKEQEVFFLKGLTDQGQILDKIEGLHSKYPEASLMKKLKIPNREVLKKILPLNYEVPNISHRGIFITKNENVTKQIKASDFVWTSGVETWKSLASEGAWVSGCFDSLGEEKAPEVDLFLGLEKPLSWFKITHKDGLENLWSKKIATYEIQYDFTKIQFQPEIEFYFWSHGELFKKYLEKFPEIKTKKHGCGLGHTYQTLKAYIPEEQLYAFVHFESWQKRNL